MQTGTGPEDWSGIRSKRRFVFELHASVRNESGRVLGSAELAWNGGHEAWVGYFKSVRVVQTGSNLNTISVWILE